MASGINIYIPKYFMAVRNCINIYVLYGLEYVSVDLFKEKSERT